MQDSLAKLSAQFAREFDAGIEEKADRRAWARVDVSKLVEALAFLKQAGYGHLSTITVLDNRDSFEAIYHLFGQGGVLSVKTQIAHEEEKLPTVSKVYPGALLYEREIFDLFGIEIEGHPDMRALILPEGWPAGAHPLRKDWTAENGGETNG